MQLNLILAVIGLAVGAYLVGSISFAVIISTVFANRDVRNYGSGNAGMTNVMRAIGLLPGIFTFILDFAKGFAVAGVGKILFDDLSKDMTDAGFFTPLNGALIGAVCCMIGHVLPVFFNFKGGKAVATGCGAFLAVCPIAAVVGLGLFIVSFIITRIISLSSLIGTASVVVCSMIVTDLGPGAFAVLQVFLHVFAASIVFVKHKENIIRLIRGEEKKLSIKKEK